MDRRPNICENLDTLVYVRVLDLAQVGSVAISDREQVLVNRAQRTPDGVFLLRVDNELRLKRVQRVLGY